MKLQLSSEQFESNDALKILIPFFVVAWLLNCQDKFEHVFKPFSVSMKHSSFQFFKWKPAFQSVRVISEVSTKRKTLQIQRHSEVSLQFHSWDTISLEMSQTE